MEELHLLAVYGDLREGCSSHNEILKHQTRIGDFDSEPIYSMYSFTTFPALVKNGNTSIKMEVYEITDRILNRLNRLQTYEKGKEVDNFYNIETIDTPYGEAKVYIFNQKVTGKALISTGDWVAFKNEMAMLIKTNKLTSRHDY